MRASGSDARLTGHQRVVICGFENSRKPFSATAAFATLVRPSRAQAPAVLDHPGALPQGDGCVRAPRILSSAKKSERHRLAVVRGSRNMLLAGVELVSCATSPTATVEVRLRIFRRIHRILPDSIEIEEAICRSVYCELDQVSSANKRRLMTSAQFN